MPLGLNQPHRKQMSQRCTKSHLLAGGDDTGSQPLLQPLLAAPDLGCTGAGSTTENPAGSAPQSHVLSLPVPALPRLVMLSEQGWEASFLCFFESGCQLCARRGDLHEFEFIECCSPRPWA